MKKSHYLITKTETMAKGWSQLLRLTVTATLPNAAPIDLVREVADHGHGASILPVNWQNGTVLLVKQWRAGAAFTGHDGWLIETCAGLLDADDPAGCATREAFEEMGVKVRNVQHVLDCFASPGAFSEKISLFMAEYRPQDRITKGGGLASEHEDIEVLEMPLIAAHDLIAKGEIVDAKTIILLQHAVMLSRKTD